MATSPRTFVVKSDKLMKGDDIKRWQRLVRDTFDSMFNLKCPIEIDGVYGAQTRAYSADLVKAVGMNPVRWMADGLTHELREIIRNRRWTPAQIKQRQSKARKDFRAKLKERWSVKKVHPPVNKILTDTWGFHPPVHDGVDVICGPDAVIFAMCRAKVIDVRSGGWWGKAPSGDVSKGDGIIQIQILEDVGPFKKGHVIGYGHAEKAVVKVGEVVRAGQMLGHAGLAVAWHVHLMHNDGKQGGRGVGTLDPRPLLDYSVKNG